MIPSVRSFASGVASLFAGVLVASSSASAGPAADDVRMGAVQAFEADGRILIFVAVDRRFGTGLDAEWRTAAVARVTVSDGAVEFRRCEVGPLGHIHPAAVTIFGDGDEVYAHRHAGGRDRFYRWGPRGPEPLADGEAADLAVRTGLVLTTPAEAVQKLTAFRDGAGWRELPTDSARLIDLGAGIRSERLGPTDVPAEIELDYEGRGVRVTFPGGEATAGEVVEVNLAGGAR